MTSYGTTNLTMDGVRDVSEGRLPATPVAKRTTLARLNVADHPADAEFHSLLLLSTEKKLYRLPVDEMTGDYSEAITEIQTREEGYRKVINIAGENASDSEQSSKMTVALLPIKDEPNSGFICCYLANANRLNLAQGSAEAWLRDKAPPRSGIVASLLVARTDAAGILNAIEIDGGTPCVQDEEEYTAARALLAQGCVAGEVETKAGLVPLVNLARLQPKPAGRGASPAMATVNPRGKVFAIGTGALRKGVMRRAEHLANDGLVDLAERKHAMEKPKARGEQRHRRNAAQDANIAVAILPLADAGIPLSPEAGLDSAQAPVILFNALRLNVKNVWTVAEWSDQNQVDPLTNAPPLNLPFTADLPQRSSARLFVALEPGTVYDIDLAKAEPLDRGFLAKNTEVWRLLRNGCLAGRVEAAEKSYDLLNLAAFGGTLQPATLEPRTVLASTWDFKWPARKRLRVRFAPLQKPDNYTPEVVRVLKEKVGRLVRSWVHDDEGKRRANLELNEDDFADLKESGALDDYDILIDLSDMPVQIPGGKSRPAREARLPFSEIGSYAGRLPYGEPTIWLGFPDGIKGEDAAAILRTTRVVKKSGRDDLDGYFGSAAFEHIVLHEFGHALGLPHLHQSPDLSDPFVDVDQARELIERELGVVMTAAEVLEQLKLRWSGPGAGGRTDWFDVIGRYAAHIGTSLADFTVALETERLRQSIGPLEQGLVAWLADGSVMMGLPARIIYKGHQLKALDYKTELGAIDKAWIKMLYP